MRLLPPHTICRWFGHKRELYLAGHYHDRRGRLRERWYSRCTRCGTDDGGEVYTPGILQRWTPRTLLRCWRRWWHETLPNWWRQDCEDCGKPTVRFGRAVGNHEGCDVIPF